MRKTTSYTIDSGPSETTTKKSVKKIESLAFIYMKARNERPSALFSLGVITALLAFPYQTQA